VAGYLSRLTTVTGTTAHVGTPEIENVVIVEVKRPDAKRFLPPVGDGLARTVQGGRPHSGKIARPMMSARSALKLLIRFFSGAHALIAVLFTALSFLFLFNAARTGWDAIGLDALESANEAIEAIGLLAISVLCLQIAQTITEEEVIRDAHISAPTRVRRYLSRFLVVIVVALSLEGLVASFKTLHDDPEMLPDAAAVLIAAAVLLASWGVFIRFNRFAEELEPEAMAEAKKEDAKLEQH
jgi:hypothetical protein